MEKKLNLREQIARIFCVIAGNVNYALAVKFFLIPGGLVLVFNVIMLAAGFFVLGSRFALTTIVSTFTYPSALEVLDRLFPGAFITDDVIGYCSHRTLQGLFTAMSVRM